MSWSEEARVELDVHLARMEASLVENAEPGVDPAEVVADLRHHVAMELGGRSLVTRDDVLAVLARMGLAAQPGEVPRAAPVRAQPHRFARFGVITLGVIWPAVVLAVEATTHMCANQYFDPLPRPWHAVLIAIVPCANLAALSARARERHRSLLLFLNGAALAIACMYAVIFLPLLPLALFALVMAGLGALPLGPFAAVAGTLLARRVFLSENAAPRRSAFAPSLIGAACALAAPVALNAPQVVSTLGLSFATSHDAGRRQFGIDLLRAFGGEQGLLRHCYERPRGIEDPVTALVAASGHTSSAQAREVYYLVTGRPFDSVTPPDDYRSLWLESPRFTADEALGSDDVEGRRTGLSLASSRIDATVDADAAHAYFEWQLRFENEQPFAAEARACVSLPPGGVVSRLTLWIDGEEREAAFGSRGATRAAYSEVVARQLDPVLVTTDGVDRVFVQCFPVPSDGDMQVRLGITTPLALPDLDSALLAFPRFVERNFEVGAEHAVWIDARSDTLAIPDGLEVEELENGGSLARGSLSEAALSDPATHLAFARSRAASESFAHALDGEGFVRQWVRTGERTKVGRVCLVIDGSAGLAPHAGAIAAALDALPAGTLVEALVAGDSVERILSPPQAAGPVALRRLSVELESRSFAGGCNNAEALLDALLSTIGLDANAVVLWLFGSQPHVFDSTTALRQALERAPRGPELWALCAAPGPNTVLEEIEDLPRVRVLPRLGPLRTDLERAFASLGGTETVELVRERVAATDALPADARPTSKHLARLWAADEVIELVRTGDTGSRTKALELAVAHQLVTAVSGAVVLETAEQYRRAGLSPVDPGSVPSVPEPATWALLAVAAALLAAYSWVRARGGAA